MQILVREGSVCKDLHALAPMITERNSPFIAFCTDDRNPLDIAEEGHLDFIIRTAIALGAPPLAAYRAASISAARIFGLHDRGLVAPGWRADLFVIESLESCTVGMALPLIGHGRHRSGPSVPGSSTTGLVSSPTPSMRTVTESPAASHRGGSSPAATPAGVPVVISMPTSRVNAADRCSIIWAQVKIMSAVVPS